MIPYEANPRQITEKQAKDLKASLAKFGIADPIIINTDNMIIGGHQRKKILETLLGYDPDFQIDVRVPDRELSIDEARELNVRLNKNVAEWDFDTLANNFELDDLLDWGFDKHDLDLDLWAGDAPEDVEPQIDKAEELREKWGVETGQLWQLGAHRLICGDCTDKAVVDRVMGGEVAVLMVTDPPYGVAYDANWRNEMDRANGKPYGERAIGKVTNDDRIDWGVAYSLFTGDVVYVWHCDRSAREASQNIEDAGFDIVAQIIWVKNNIVIGRGDYHYKHEPCWYAVRKGKNHNWQGSRKESSVWEIDKPLKSETGHSTQKPLECMSKPIENNTAVGELVYDPFLGSGTTLIACERLGRKCRAVEISPAYCAVAIQRWVDVTGGVPELIGED